jgi:DNA-binding LacI/PurR family transcriptional regulator
MRATVRDVAALAGVSPKTVSNVINGGVPVRPDTRERVESALAELDYVPNLSARGLRNGRSGTIALALPDLGTPYSAELARWFVELARVRGWAVQIEQTGSDPARELELISRARAHLVDGLILNPVTLGESVVANGRGLPPTVVIGEVEPQDVDQVHIDSFAAARDMTARLVALGHRRIAVVGTSDDDFRTATSEIRHAGHRAALAAAGITEDPTLAIAVGTWSSAAAAGAVEGYLDSGSELPDAIVCFTDSMAIGVLHVLAEHGVRVPQDVAVVGFDDVDEAAFAVPSLTTVSFDKRAIAEAALTALERRIGDPDAPRTVQVVAHRIVERSSTARRRA